MDGRGGQKGTHTHTHIFTVPDMHTLTQGDGGGSWDSWT